MGALVNSISEVLAALFAKFGYVGRPRRRANLRDEIKLLEELRASPAFGPDTDSARFLTNHIANEVAGYAGVLKKRKIPWGTVGVSAIIGLPFSYWTTRWFKTASFGIPSSRAWLPPSSWSAASPSCLLATTPLRATQTATNRRAGGSRVLAKCQRTPRIRTGITRPCRRSNCRPDAEIRSRPHSTDTARRDHNPRVGVRVPPPASFAEPMHLLGGPFQPLSATASSGFETVSAVEVRTRPPVPRDLFDGLRDELWTVKWVRATAIDPETGVPDSAGGL